ncbi:FGGY-family carbohydrate kinase [Jiangella alkaliphila]|uniref:Xylulokinase n=1 Tax=Jiangella alkaliphila TaxID=419479 RepID=A0A1H2IZP3_9ACTN|nr:FGGY-family carbohydrate kinase [Jiangella alkaliphila]SDU49613.1 xylulokinase [Jiangella alkaliphila]
MPEFVLGIDIGTASSKAVLASTGGEVVAVEVVEHDTSRPRPGWVEQDADAVWWADVCELSRRMTERFPAGSIGAVCVSGIGPTALVAGADGAPLRPAILYGVDTRAVGQAAALSSRLGEDAVLERCGSRLSSQSAGPKLAWIRENEPDVWARTRYFFMANSYVVYRLTGAYVLDHHSANQAQPLYDRRRGEWIAEWAEVVAPGLALPSLRWPTDVAGHVTAEAAAATGLPAGTPVVVGTIDAWAEAESVDVGRPGDVMIMYGSTMFFIAVTSTPVAHPQLWGTVGQHPGLHTLAGGMASSGSITGWFRDLTGGRPYPSLLADAAAVPAGSDGLLALPYFDGERTPFADPDARGVLAGLTLRHSTGHVYRALLEATAFGVRHNLAEFAAAGVTASRVVAVGGGTQGDLWTTIVSSAAGVTQEVPRVTVGAAYGDAKFAAVAIGAADRDADWNGGGVTVAPDPADAAVYDRLFPLYRELHERTADVQHALAVGARR